MMQFQPIWAVAVKRLRHEESTKWANQQLLEQYRRALSFLSFSIRGPAILVDHRFSKLQYLNPRRLKLADYDPRYAARPKRAYDEVD